MELSLEAVLLTIFIVLPGFTHFGASSVFASPARHRPSDLQIVLRSLAISALLLSVEILAVSLAGVLWQSLADEIGTIVRDGAEAYGERHPLEVLASATALTLANMVILGIAGWFEVPQAWIRHQQATRGISPHRVWTDVIGQLGPRDAPALGTRVYLKDGGVYAGALANWSLGGEDQGGADIALRHPVFTTGEKDDIWRSRGTAVVIPAREIRCFELYTDQESNGADEPTPTETIIGRPEQEID